MSLFSKIMDKIFHHDARPAPPAATTTPIASAGLPSAAGQPAPTAPPPAVHPAEQEAPPSGATPAVAAVTPDQQVDVEAVLAELAGRSGGGGNWRTSIVDLLKLLNLDSDLAARKELAQELNVHAGEHGTAEQNTALHRAVMKKLAENGGKVPDSLKD